MQLISLFYLVATLLVLATNASADLVITSPNETSFIVSDGQLPIAWTYSGPMPPNPATISVELVDNSKKLFTGPLALFSNLATSLGRATWSVPKTGYAGSNFSIILMGNVNNQATIFAQGRSFSIMPAGTPPPAGQTPEKVSAAAPVYVERSIGTSILILVSSILTYLCL